jgi:hypothetical protein
MKAILNKPSSVTGAFKCDQVQKEAAIGLASFLEKGDFESLLEMLTLSGASRWTSVYGKGRNSVPPSVASRRSVWASLQNSDEDDL